MILVLSVLAATVANAQDSRPLVAIGGIMHESNSFSTVKTKLEDFTRRGAGSDTDALKQ